VRTKDSHTSPLSTTLLSHNPLSDRTGTYLTAVSEEGAAGHVGEPAERDLQEPVVSENQGSLVTAHPHPHVPGCGIEILCVISGKPPISAEASVPAEKQSGG
jgi:hypothetical protein